VFLGAAAVCAIALYGAVGHAVGLTGDMEDAMGGHGVAGLCLVLFTLLAPLAASACPRGRLPVVLRTGVPARQAVLPATAPAARASPAWLQRFLH
jgi:hypothetical protein